MRCYLDTGSRWMNMIIRWRGRGAFMRTFAVIPLITFILLVGNVAIVQAAVFRAHYAGAVTTTEIDINVDEEETARTSQGGG